MIILNEREYAAECLRTRSYGDNIFTTVQILSKYYYDNGYREKRIEKFLFAFLEECYPGYAANKRRWADTVEHLARHAGKYKLYENVEVWITQTELDSISEITVEGWKDSDLRRLAFTFLCLAKLYNARNEKNNNWVNTAVNDVFDMAHVTASKKDKYKMLGSLDKIGILSPAKKNENLSSQVLIVDNKSERVFSVSDFRDLGFEYAKYIGENYIRCANCGRLVKGNKAGTKKYCSECAGYQPKEDKALTCVDCGKTFTVAASNKRSIRCHDCQKEFTKKYDRIRKLSPTNSVF